MAAIIDFGFDIMELNRIEALVQPDNIASIKLLKRLSFNEEGVLRDYQTSKGTCIDVTMFSILKREYKKEFCSE